MTAIEKQLNDVYRESTPCGAAEIPASTQDRNFFKVIEGRRDRPGLMIHKLPRFQYWEVEQVLQVGCGVVTGLLRFVRGGAFVRGVDL